MKRPIQAGRYKRPTCVGRRRAARSYAEECVHGLTNALRQIAATATNGVARPDSGKLPHEQRPPNLIKIEIYKLVEQLMRDGRLWVLDRWLSEYNPRRRRKPTVSQQPYLAALLALNWFCPLSPVERRVFGYQLHLARQRGVPAHLIPGFVWQIGIVASRPPKGTPYWAECNYDPEDEDWSDDGFEGDNAVEQPGDDQMSRQRSRSADAIDELAGRRRPAR